MANTIWDFTADSTSVIKTLRDADPPREQTFNDLSLRMVDTIIYLYEAGQYASAVKFEQIGTIDGVAPTDLQDAFDKILAIIPASGGGGSQDLESVLTEGSTASIGTDIDLTVTDGTDLSNLLISYDQTALSNTVGSKTSIVRLIGGALNITQTDATGVFGTAIGITSPTANRAITFPDKSGTVAMTSDINGGALIYRALLTQSGTSDPTAVVLENTFASDIVWTRNTNGFYQGSLVGIYDDPDKLFSIVSQNGTGSMYRANIKYDGDPDYLILSTADYTTTLIDDALFRTSIEILLYP